MAVRTLFTCYCLLLAINLNLVASYTLRLIFTHVIYRHGERSPLSTYPNDPYQEKIWPTGFAQLLPLGCQQQYHLGIFLRKHYNNFLSPHYNVSEIYVRSTDSDRTLASAYCNLAGLYPPYENQLWNSHIPWQPIPVHTVPIKEDFLLKTHRDCPAKERLRTEKDQLIISKIDKAYGSFFQFLSTETGMQNFSLSNVGKLLGVLSRQQQFGYRIPSWVQTTWFDPRTVSSRKTMDILKDLHVLNMLMRYSSPEKARFEAGVLVGSVVSEMRDRIEGKKIGKQPTKMYMYSTHDNTLLAFLSAINMSNNLLPPIAACLMVELYKDGRDNYFVTVRYKNDTSSLPYTLKSPACNQEMCPFKVFQASVAKTSFNSVSERNKACK